MSRSQPGLDFPPQIDQTPPMFRFLFLASAITAFVACSRDQAAPNPPNDAPAPAPGPAPKPTDDSAQAALDRMDEREPVPLLPMMALHQKENMRDHLVAVQEIVAALATDDFAGVEKAAGRIGFSDRMAQMCTHMGAGAPGFTEHALGFHRTADRIAEAARERDRARVLTELGATLATCTSCHAKWKQKVVDEGAWRQMTQAAPPVHGGH